MKREELWFLLFLTVIAVGVLGAFLWALEQFQPMQLPMVSPDKVLGK
jgi:hypothetical protein